MSQDKAAGILAAIGGSDNVIEIEPCITRLRCELSNPDLVDEPALRRIGVHGVLRSGDAVQIVVGPDADNIASDIEDLR